MNYTKLLYYYLSNSLITLISWLNMALIYIKYNNTCFDDSHEQSPNYYGSNPNSIYSLLILRHINSLFHRPYFINIQYFEHPDLVDSYHIVESFLETLHTFLDILLKIMVQILVNVFQNVRIL